MNYHEIWSIGYLKNTQVHECSIFYRWYWGAHGKRSGISQESNNDKLKERIMHIAAKLGEKLETKQNRLTANEEDSLV